MKKIIYLIALFALSTQTIQAQSLEQIVAKASETKNVEHIKMNSFLLAMGKLMASADNLPSISKNIKRIEISSFSNCNTTDKNEISNAIKKMNTDANQEILLHVKDKGDDVKIMTQKKKGNISELAILVANQDNPAIIRLIGKITQQDIDELINQYNND